MTLLHNQVHAAGASTYVQWSRPRLRLSLKAHGSDRVDGSDSQAGSKGSRQGSEVIDLGQNGEDSAICRASQGPEYHRQGLRSHKVMSQTC